jgi:dolichol-phosphate mannosyltransferase
MKSLVIIPTYNEKENIQPLIQSIFSATPHVHILVVDDSSPDGTQWIVEKTKPHYPQKLHLLLRTQKQGLGKAYLAGFHWGLSHGYEALVEMDADFSHRPQDLVTILETLKTHDVVVGSRYVTGGETKNWGFVRKMISQGGSFYARQILRYPLADWTGGFNAWKAPVLQAINLSSIESEGYSFQIELKYKALRHGFIIKEIPIIFEDRRVGQSKMSSRIVLEALFKVWRIKK